MAGFRFDNRALLGSDVRYDHLELAPSLSVVKGDALKLSNGKLALCGTTDKAQFVADEDKVSGAADIVKIRVIPTLHGLALFNLKISPIAKDVSATGTTSQIKIADDITGDGTDNDMRGGIVRVVSTGERRIITGNTYSGGVNTLAFSQPLKAALAVGDDVELVLFGPGLATVRFNGEDSIVINDVAGMAGGNIGIFDVSDDLKEVLVYFVP